MHTEIMARGAAYEPTGKRFIRLSFIAVPLEALRTSSLSIQGDEHTSYTF